MFPTQFVFVDRAVEVIRKHSSESEKPLFLYLPMQSVHSPLQVINEVSQKFVLKPCLS